MGVSVTAHAHLTRVNSQYTGTMDKENLPPSHQSLAENDQPPSKKAKLSLSLKKKRFGDSVSSELVTLWYYSSPVGEQKLNSMVKEMFAAVGITGKTNHSL